jgi:hypothetical protein
MAAFKALDQALQGAKVTLGEDRIVVVSGCVHLTTFPSVC